MIEKHGRPFISLAIAALVTLGASASARSAPEPAHPDSSMQAAAPDSTERASGPIDFPGPDSTLVPNLRDGGFIIVFRHCATEWDQRDTDAENFEDRSTQRNLSKLGEEQATGIGNAIRKLDIPIVAVLTSPMWRCRDTGRLAFGQEQPSVELFRRGPEYKAARIVLMSTELDAGMNLVLVTHQDLLLPIVDGLKRDYLREGDCLVIRPFGEGKFDVVAKVTPENWAKLAGLPPPPKIPPPPGVVTK